MLLKFNKPLALYILKEVGEEGLEEFASNLAVLIRQSSIGLTQWLALTAFKNIRRFIKEAAKNPDSAISKVGNLIFGSKFENMVKSWGEEGSKPWSFALAFEEWIESIENPYLQEFTEEFFDEAFDACQEAIFVVAASAESFLMQQRLANEQILGPERVVEILPDRSTERIGAERLIIAGPEQLVRANMINAGVMYQMLDNRDVGQIVGEPVPDVVRNAEWENMITIQWRGVKTPPWRDSLRAQCSIKGVSRSKLDWELIKRLAGGTNGRMWGRFEIEAATNIGKPTLWAATAEQGIDELTALIEGLTDQEIYGIDPREETKSGKRKKHESLYKQPTRVYPAFVTIINKTKILNELDGRAEYSGVYKQKPYRMPLWTDNRPSDWDQMIQEIFHTPGTKD